MMFLTWTLLGYDLVVHKAQQGEKVTWVGYTIELTQEAVEVTIKKEFMQDLKS